MSHNQYKVSLVLLKGVWLVWFFSFDHMKKHGCGIHSLSCWVSGYQKKKVDNIVFKRHIYRLLRQTEFVIGSISVRRTSAELILQRCLHNSDNHKSRLGLCNNKVGGGRKRNITSWLLSTNWISWIKSAIETGSAVTQIIWLECCHQSIIMKTLSSCQLWRAAHQWMNKSKQWICIVVYDHL